LQCSGRENEASKFHWKFLKTDPPKTERLKEKIKAPQIAKPAHLQNLYLAPEALVAALSRHSAIRYFSLSSQSWCWISLSTFKVPWGKLDVFEDWQI